MTPAKLIGDVISALVALAVVGVLVWFDVSQLFPGLF